MRLPLALIAVLTAVIFGGWAWLGAPVAMPASPLAAGEKLQCVSYAPFRPGQSPFDLSTRIEPRQIEEDLALLAPVTQCVRTYSTDFGLDHVPEIAKRHGLKVIQGLWLSGEPEKNLIQIQTAIDLAKRYPDVITAVVVGNEVLLRGEIAPANLLATIRKVKAEIAPVQVTYADVWEFWLRNPELLDGVDFVTVHILPYWEDFPIPADKAGAHIDAIRQQVANAFPGKEILIGETGWPSVGRMREGALPSPVSQARVMHDVLTLAKWQNYRVNLIEAFDQPWKRQLEGTVGGHWGLLASGSREVKFAWGRPVSNHPFWIWQACGGVALVLVTFAAAQASARRKLQPEDWLAIAAIVLGPGLFAGWALANVPLESLGPGDVISQEMLRTHGLPLWLGAPGWIRSLALAGVALAAPVVAAVAVARDVSIPRFAQMMARSSDRLRDRSTLALGAVLIVVCVLAVERALLLTFNHRYIDFAFAPLTAAITPFLVLALLRPSAGMRGTAEIVMAGVLGSCAICIAVNESFGNWQALWCCAALVALAITLLRPRAAPGSGSAASRQLPIA